MQLVEDLQPLIAHGGNDGLDAFGLKLLKRTSESSSLLDS